jgi:hypothetical protein
MRRDDEQYIRDRQRDAGDERSSGSNLELRDLRRSEPQSGEHDGKEADLREACSSNVGRRRFTGRWFHGSHNR